MIMMSSSKRGYVGVSMATTSGGSDILVGSYVDESAHDSWVAVTVRPERVGQQAHQSRIDAGGGRREPQVVIGRPRDVVRSIRIHKLRVLAAVGHAAPLSGPVLDAAMAEGRGGGENLAGLAVSGLVPVGPEDAVEQVGTRPALTVDGAAFQLGVVSHQRAVEQRGRLVGLLAVERAAVVTGRIAGEDTIDNGGGIFAVAEAPPLERALLSAKTQDTMLGQLPDRLKIAPPLSFERFRSNVQATMMGWLPS